MKKLSLIIAAVLSAAAVLSSCAEKTDNNAGELVLPALSEEEIMNTIDLGLNIDRKHLVKSLKPSGNANPISPNVFCADPTSVEYNGRLYVYGTNDHQQYEEVGNDGKNSYEKIKSLVVFSTDDMVNWVYHGRIEVGEIAPWIYTSWAPSITSRVEEDGLTHFYLYFSNSGSGVGVITSTDPVTGWTDPLGKPLISSATEGLGDCPNPFDPGVCIDDDGVGWLSFGAGIAADGSEYMTKAIRIVRLGSDMISLDSEIAQIPTYYAFEASELNYINGEYVYTYNTSWAERTEWKLDCDPPAACSMAYMTTKTPLDPDSWEYRGHYFLNPGESGMDYSNNHTHIHKYKGQWYVIYHSLVLQERSETRGGFRSMQIDTLDVNESKIKITLRGGSREGVEGVKSLNPFVAHSGTEMYNAAGIWYEYADNNSLCSVTVSENAWICLKNVDFDSSAKRFLAKVKGKGKLQVCIDSNKDGEIIASAEFDSDSFGVISADISQGVSGIHDIYIQFSNTGMTLESWQFE